MAGRARLGGAARVAGHGAGLQSGLGQTQLAGLQVDRRGLLSVGQVRGQTEGRKLHGAFLQLHREKTEQKVPKVESKVELMQNIYSRNAK